MNRAARRGVWLARTAVIVALPLLVSAACGRTSADGPPATPVAGAPVQAPPVAPPERPAPQDQTASTPTPTTTPPPAVARSVPTAPLAVPASVSADDAGVADTSTATTRAVELRVDGVERVWQIGTRRARPGHEFVILSTAWKNVIPLRAVNKNASKPYSTGGFSAFGGGRRSSAEGEDVSMEPTAYVVPMLRNQMWLLSDGRFADTVDTDAQPDIADGLPVGGFSIAKLDEVVRGKVVFEAPAGATYQALQFYDTNNGHALIALTGRDAPAAPAALGAVRQNALLQLAVTEARFLDAGDDAAATRPYLIGVRGSSRSPTDVVVIPAQYVLAQTDEGCLVTSEPGVPGVSRPFGRSASFLPTAENEVQLVFAVPAGTRGVQLLLRAQNQSMDLPVQNDFHVSWPTPARTIADGAVLRVHVLPAPPRPSHLPPATEGRVHQLLDVVLENLRPNSGVEFQPEQLRLVAADGTFIAPAPSSAGMACRLGPDGVVPAQTARRFTLVYDVPADQRPQRLQYRGFELQETVVDLP